MISKDVSVTVNAKVKLMMLNCNFQTERRCTQSFIYNPAGFGGFPASTRNNTNAPHQPNDILGHSPHQPNDILGHSPKPQCRPHGKQSCIISIECVTTGGGFFLDEKKMFMTQTANSRVV